MVGARGRRREPRRRARARAEGGSDDPARSAARSDARHAAALRPRAGDRAASSRAAASPTRWSRRCSGARFTRSSPAATPSTRWSTRRCAPAAAASTGTPRATSTRCCAAPCASAARSRRASAPIRARYQHPRWWIDVAARRVSRRLGGDPRRPATAHPPMCLRVNRGATQRRRLPGAARCRTGIAARRVGRRRRCCWSARCRWSVCRASPSGDVSVQDAGAQRAAALLDLRDGQRVLDACAAPGGKSAHMLEARATSSSPRSTSTPARCARR